MISNYLAFALSIPFLIASPGPIVALVIADAKYVFPIFTILGGALSAQVLMICALAMTYFALDINVNILNVGRIVGGIYLILLGMALLRNRNKKQSQNKVIVKKNHDYFWRALKVGISNPKDILFFLSFLPSFIQPNKSFGDQALILLLIFALIDMIIMFLYVLFSHQFLKHPIGRLFLCYFPSIFMLGIGFFSLYMGFSSLFST